MSKRVASGEWSVSRVGYMWIFDWVVGLIFRRIRGFYSDFFVDGRNRAYSGKLESTIAKSLFQVDLALAPLRAIVLTLLLYGFGVISLYAFPGSVGTALEEMSSIGVDLCFSYAGALGFVSAVEFVRAARFEKVSSPEAFFGSLSRAAQAIIFALASIVAFLFISLVS